MKKAFYIVWIIVLLFVWWSASYYFIIQANMLRTELNRKNSEFINQQIEKCEKKYEWWEKTNSYDWDNNWSSQTRLPKISYNLDLNACVGYWDEVYYRSNYSVREYSAKITDLSHEKVLFYCASNLGQDCDYEVYQKELSKRIAK